MPSAIGVAHDGINFGAPLTSTRHILQLPSSDVGVVAVPGDLDAHFVRNLNDALTFFRVVRLSVDRELGHKQARVAWIN